MTKDGRLPGSSSTGSLKSYFLEVRPSIAHLPNHLGATSKTVVQKLFDDKERSHRIFKDEVGRSLATYSRAPVELESSAFLVVQGRNTLDTCADGTLPYNKEACRQPMKEFATLRCRKHLWVANQLISERQLVD